MIALHLWFYDPRTSWRSM